MVAVHVEARFRQQVPYGGHVGAGPQVKTSRSRKSGATCRSVSIVRRPRYPPQGAYGRSSSQMWTTRMLGAVAAMRSSSWRKTMSAGVRALCTNTTSAGSARSYSVLVIDIDGVTPTPPDRNRYLGAGCRAVLNSPSGPCARTVSPGRSRSCSQFDTSPPGMRFTVIESRNGRVGDEEMV